ncbi:MAG: GTP-binding protein HSR1 [Sulfobacillus thermosulfidooxidans]|uniref:Ribosome biogenesis GTPase A n=1 Tax=Sulfobacillus thermosulfidooxidans TaxID=28034 RepID=A0A2T2X5U3_SULTH|nr:MAG: GTP-binding protein HSR1 [Sulfobacillus thermosulfidooxidans]
MGKRQSWYPGHMVATQRTIRELAPYLSAFIEVIDARAPNISRHQPLQQWIGRTQLIMVMNKAELADPDATQRWLGWFKSQGVTALAISAQNPRVKIEVEKAIRRILAPPYRLAVVGVPNVGKSTLLNKMVGGHRVMTGAKPGITRGPQWIRLPGGWEWLDLPGVVTPRHSEDWRLKVLGIVPSTAEERLLLVDKIWELVVPQMPLPENWRDWGRSRGYLKTGGVLDEQRTADAIVLAFQNGKFGRVTLEEPGEG